MMAMTTSSSINVNPTGRRRLERMEEYDAFTRLKDWFVCLQRPLKWFWPVLAEPREFNNDRFALERMIRQDGWK